MGKDKFKTTLKIGQAGVSVDVPIDEATRIVSLYRTKYDKIAALWGQGQEALKAMVNGYTYELGVGIKLKCSPDGIELPNGMMMRYTNLRNDGQGGYLYDSRYGPNKIYGGKVIENVVQALARIVVFNQMAKIDQWCRKQDNPEAGRRYKVALTVHDEVVAVAPDNTAQTLYEFMMHTMSQAPNWAPTLPVACEGDVAKNYADCK
jgi:DNA polymerase